MTMCHDCDQPHYACECRTGECIACGHELTAKCLNTNQVCDDCAEHMTDDEQKALKQRFEEEG